MKAVLCLAMIALNCHDRTNRSVRTTLKEHQIHEPYDYVEGSSPYMVKEELRVIWETGKTKNELENNVKHYA